jgi:hypothetical protein
MEMPPGTVRHDHNARPAKNMINNADTSYTFPAGTIPERRKPYMIPSERRKTEVSCRISLSRPKTMTRPYPGQDKKISREDQMKDVNKEAFHSANQCRVIGNLTYFSEKTRRGIALKQRFRPGEGVHPLFLTI